MPLQIQSQPSSPADAEQIAQEMRERIVEALPGAAVTVTPLSPGHFEVAVVSSRFEGESRVRQQQLVYAAIAPLMKGDPAPVHAIDRLLTELP